MIKNKKGGIYIEASVAMPAACVISVLLVSITISFYSGICRQVSLHREELSKISGGYEAVYIRRRDAAEAEIFS